MKRLSQIPIIITSLRAGTVLAAVFLVALALTVSSCKKSKTEVKDNAKFVGAWHGTALCSFFGGTGPVDTFSFTFYAGTSSNALTLPMSVASDTSCITPVIVNLTVSGNNLTMPAQSFTDGCGVQWTYSGDGTLKGDTLSMALTASFSMLSLPISTTCTIKLTK